MLRLDHMFKQEKGQTFLFTWRHQNGFTRNLNVPMHCHLNILIVKNEPFPASLYYIFVFSIQLTVNKCLDSNLEPLELEATAIPTEPQQLPNILIVYITKRLLSSRSFKRGLF